MTSQFKNRLVGVTILVACVVIFLPSIIDGKKTIYEDDFISTPIKPPVQAHTKLMQPIVSEDSLPENSTSEKSNDFEGIKITQWVTR